MYDDRPLVDLINSRFDDLTDRISDLKRDMIRAHEKHEQDDNERFGSISQKLTRLDKLEWMVLGGSLVVALAFNLVIALFR